jgi:hypothetical protein
MVPHAIVEKEGLKLAYCFGVAGHKHLACPFVRPSGLEARQTGQLRVAFRTEFSLQRLISNCSRWETVCRGRKSKSTLMVTVLPIASWGTRHECEEVPPQPNSRSPESISLPPQARMAYLGLAGFALQAHGVGRVVDSHGETVEGHGAQGTPLPLMAGLFRAPLRRGGKRADPSCLGAPAPLTKPARWDSAPYLQFVNPLDGGNGHLARTSPAARSCGKKGDAVCAGRGAFTRPCRGGTRCWCGSS